MNRPLECVKCLVNSRVSDAVRLGLQENEISTLLEYIASLIRCRADRSTAFTDSFEFIKMLVGREDPYENLKSSLRNLAYKLYNDVREAVSNAGLEEILYIAASSNFFDTQVLGYEFKPETVCFEKVFSKPRIIVKNSIPRMIESADKIIYILDNEGESVVDSIVINELLDRGFKVEVLVRSSAYEIDVCLKDTRTLPLKAPVKHTRTPLPPTYEGVDCSGDCIVVAKGIANLEGFVDSRRCSCNILFLLRAKCPVLARTLGVELGEAVIMDKPSTLEIADKLAVQDKL